MFVDRTDYTPKGPKEWGVAVGAKVIGTGLTYAEALRLAQRTKGSRTVKATA